MILPGSYANGFAPRDGQPVYPELWRGCVGAWAPSLGPSGLLVRDWSGLKNDMTLVNGPVMAPNRGAYALTFDGSNDYGQTTLVPPSGTMNMTYHCWVRYTSSSQFAGLMYWRNGSFPFQNMAIGILLDSAGNPGAKLFAQDNNSGTTNRFALSSSTFNDGQWHAVGAVRSDAAMSLYVDGRLEATATGTKPDIYHTAPLFIGTRSNSSTAVGTLAGDMDDVMVWMRDLSPLEMRLLARRRGIAYELAPRRRASSGIAFNRRRRLLVGAGT